MVGLARKTPKATEIEVIKAPPVEKSVARIAAMVGLYLARDANQQEQALYFTKAGFTASEIGQMLDIPTKQVYAGLFQIRKKGQEADKKGKQGK